ncbi:MAG: Lrp/AsnC family transcriptional regulator [Chloroflexi bacterium]|nr:Lrp/AsnC family transcriptional regulator [Chloroflexota bacterium]
MSDDLRSQLDETDWIILSELQKDARLSYAELGRTIHLSRPAAAERIHRLESMGVIAGYRAEINLSSLGYGITAFLRISVHGPVTELLGVVRSVPEVLECHRGTGADSYILKVAVPSLWQLENVVDHFVRFGQVTASVMLSSVLNKRVVTEGIKVKSGFEDGGGI